MLKLFFCFLQIIIIPTLISGQTTNLSDFNQAEDSLNSQINLEENADYSFWENNFTGTKSAYYPINLNAHSIEHLPVRGLKNILAIQPGISMQDELLHFRGSNGAEIGYFLDGVQTNSLLGRNLVYFIPEALENLSIYTGGFSAAYGNANGGMVRGRIKTGPEKLKATVNVFSDQFASQGEALFGTYSYQNRTVVATIGGPLFSDKTRFFVAYENTFNGDTQVRFSKGFQFDDLQDVNPNRLEDGSYSIKYPDGFTPGNKLNQNALNTSMVFDLGPAKLNLVAALTSKRTFIDNEPWLNVLRDRKYYEDEDSYLFSASFEHYLSQSTSYQARVSFLDYTLESGDSYAGSNWKSWYDSAAVDIPGAYRDAWQANYSHVFLGLTFARKGQPFDVYNKHNEQQLSASLNFTHKFNYRHSLNVGLETRGYTIRSFNIRPAVMKFAADPLYGYTHGFTTYGSIKNVPELLWVNGGVEAYGYDIYGNNTNGKKSYNYDLYTEGPGQPFYAALFVQDKINWNNFTVNAGIRLEHLDSGAKAVKDPAHILVSQQSGVILQNQWKKVEPEIRVNPRLAVNYAVSENFLLYADYGTYTQMPWLDNFSLLFEPDIINSDKLEIGIWKGLFDRTYGKLSFFYNTYNYMDDPVLSNEIKGINFQFESFLASNFTSRFYYTFMDGEAVRPEYVAYVSTDNFLNIQKHKGVVNLDYIFSNSDNWLNNFSASVIFAFGSGHPYTRLYVPQGGQGDAYDAGVDYMTDPRARPPIKKINGSSTPWTHNIDLQLNKTFAIADFINTTFYVRVNNLFNTKNVVNVFPKTGSAYDDGYLSDLPGLFIEEFGQDYIDMYKAINLENGGAYKSLLGKELFGHPRQIFFGLKLSY